MTQLVETYRLLDALERDTKVGKLHIGRARAELRNVMETTPDRSVEFVSVADPALGAKEAALVHASRCVVCLERVLIELIEQRVINSINGTVVDALLEARASLKNAGCELQIIFPTSLLGYVRNKPPEGL